MVRTKLAHEVIGLAIKVHRKLGPGLFEAVYQQCLTYELVRAGHLVETEVPLKMTYEEMSFRCAYRADIIVDKESLIEVKSVEPIHPVHHAQVLTYLRSSGVAQALLINFNSTVLTKGLKSFLMNRSRGEPGIEDT